MTDPPTHNEAARPVWKRAVAIGLVLLISYPLSFGPMCWLLMRIHRLDSMERVVLHGAVWVYYPLVVTYTRSPEPIQHAMVQYLELGTPAEFDMIEDRDGIFWSGPGHTMTFLYLKP